MYDRTRRVLAGHNLTHAHWSILTAVDVEPVSPGDLLDRALVNAQGRVPVEEAGRALDHCVSQKWLTFYVPGAPCPEPAGGVVLSEDGALLRDRVGQSLRFE